MRYFRLVILCLCILWQSPGFVLALNIDSVKINFLNGNYKAAIQEGEKLLANNKNTQGLDELYYFLGLAYLKDENYLRASDIFEIILNEFEHSRFREEAGRLNKIALKEVRDTGSDLIRDSGPDTFFSIQVGSFSNNSNAQNLLQGLTQKGYPAFLEESGEGQDKIYRIKVGKLPTRQAASELQDKLRQEGFPTKVCP